MDVPVLGDVIKNEAYKTAKNSMGTAVRNKDSATEYDKNAKSGKVYTGQLDPDRPNKINLIDQYFGKIQLPAAKYKPTSDYLPFLPSISVKGDFDKSKNQDLSDVFKEINMSPQERSDLLNKGKPVYRHYDQKSALTDKLNLDLGGHKVGVGFDKDRKLPYVALSDAWDFNPDNYGKKYEEYGNGHPEDPNSGYNNAYIQSALMAKAGNPFKIYDRFYFDPKTNKYIPDDLLTKGHDK